MHCTNKWPYSLMSANPFTGIIFSFLTMRVKKGKYGVVSLLCVSDVVYSAMQYLFQLGIYFKNVFARLECDNFEPHRETLTSYE